MFFDLSKFYENINLERLEDRCRRLGFPMVIARLSIFAYKVGRFLSLGGWLEGPYFCVNGIIADCSMATTLIRVYCMEGYDSIPLAPSASLDVYIDDQGLSSTGSADSLRRRVRRRRCQGTTG
eukprot:6473096-Pyramimonas_sp.AAC.1